MSLYILYHVYWNNRIDNWCLSFSRTGSRGRIGLDLGKLALDSKIGDSIAINGCCLTITTLSGSVAQFDVSGETLDHTTLSAFRSGVQVNLERALAFGGRMGGHFVLGHVDGTGKVLKAEEQAGEWLLEVETTLVQQILLKGSIAVDGISLTVSALTEKSFSVAVIPHTIAETNLKSLKPGDKVNLETDYLGKWVLRHLEQKSEENSTKEVLSAESLLRKGF